MTEIMQEDHQGVLPRAIRSIFQQLLKQQQQASDTTAATGINGRNSTADDSCGTYEYDVRVQFLEIYGEDIRDLLNPRPQSGSSSTYAKLSIRDVGNEEPEVVGATMHKVESAEEVSVFLLRLDQWYPRFFSEFVSSLSGECIINHLHIPPLSITR